MKVLKPFHAEELNRIVEPGETFTPYPYRVAELVANGLISNGEPKMAVALRAEPVPPAPQPVAQSAPQRATLSLAPRNKDASPQRRTK